MIETPTKDRLASLGLRAAAEVMEQSRQIASSGLRASLRIAFEHFRVVEPHHLERFQRELKKRTRKRVNEYDVAFLKLKLTPLSQYPEVPPPEVLDALEKAINLKCFDYFEIATLVHANDHQQARLARWRDAMKELAKDPILFGRIKESENLYYIAQWDDDIRIEDILRAEEG